MNVGSSEEDWECAVGIEWKRHDPLDQGKTFRGAFANQNIVCKLSDSQTIRSVEEVLGVPRRVASTTE